MRFSFMKSIAPSEELWLKFKLFLVQKREKNKLLGTRKDEVRYL